MGALLLQSHRFEPEAVAFRDGLVGFVRYAAPSPETAPPAFDERLSTAFRTLTKLCSDRDPSMT
jgi:hypothetical protein